MNTLQERLREYGNAPLMFDAAYRIDELEAENAALRADAKRYRLLRSQAYEAVIPHGGTLSGKRTAWITKMYAGDSFDAAIDAARSKT